MSSEYLDLKKEVDDIGDELIAVQKDVGFMKSEVSEVKTHVTNHLPHQIMDLKESIEARLLPIETRRLKTQGVSDFLNHAVKAVVAVAGLVWTVLQITNYF